MRDPVLENIDRNSIPTFVFRTPIMKTEWCTFLVSWSILPMLQKLFVVELSPLVLAQMVTRTATEKFYMPKTVIAEVNQ